MSDTYADLPIAVMDAMLADLRAAERPIAREALRIGAEAIVSEAQTRAPVKTGLLKSSHYARTQDDEAVLGVNTGYALVVHETHKTDSRWFVRTIAEHAQRILKGALELVIKREVKP